MNRQNCSCCANGHTPGIVSANHQRVGQLFPPQTAIRCGTLYPELNKPLHCAGPFSGNTAPDACQTTAFSAWEVRLYLNTHPDDAGAVQLYQQLCRQMPEPNYACTFAPCTENGRWTWTDDPWPWECDHAARRG